MTKETYNVQNLYGNCEDAVNFAEMTVEWTGGKSTNVRPLSKRIFVMIFTLKFVHFELLECQKYAKRNIFQKRAVLYLMEKITNNKKEATRNGLLPEDFYMTTEGFMVFTEVYHLKRGYCCKNGCRHCPYGFRKGWDVYFS